MSVVKYVEKRGQLNYLYGFKIYSITSQQILQLLHIQAVDFALFSSKIGPTGLQLDCDIWKFITCRSVWEEPNKIHILCQNFMI